MLFRSASLQSLKIADAVPLHGGHVSVRVNRKGIMAAELLRNVLNVRAVGDFSHEVILPPLCINEEVLVTHPALDSSLLSSAPSLWVKSLLLE